MVGQERCKRIVSWMLEMIINHFFLPGVFILVANVFFVMEYLPNLFFKMLVMNQVLLYICVSLLEKELSCQTLRFESYN